MSNEAPASWLPIHFDEIFLQVSTSGKKVKTGEILREGKFPVVDQGRAFISGYLDDESLVVTDENPLIIFGDHTREIKWIDFGFIPGADGVKLLKPHPEMDGRFLYFFLRYLPIESKGYARHFKLLKDAEYRVPPVAEQTRISQKLNELLAQIDSLEARFEAISTLLKRFRQSILAAAASGRLTEEWRKLSSAPNPTKAKIGDFVIGMNGGASPSTSDYSSDGIPALNKGDIKENGKILLKKSPKFVPKSYADAHCKKIIPQGSVLVTLRDLSQKANFLGLAAIYEGTEPALITQGMYHVILNNCALLDDFFILLSNSPQYREQVKREKVGATQVHLRNDQFLQISFLAFSINEQAEIVSRVEQLFAFAHQLESKVEAAKNRIGHLTQSILVKAFSGELVPQDPDDEPASVLLDRIKAKHVSAPKAKRGRKASP